MLPPIAVLSTTDGTVTVIGVAAGAVPATAVLIGGLAVSPDGKLYVVYQ